jgi:tRNA A-37 threonylcarbamoyl transferase component Bud32
LKSIHKAGVLHRDIRLPNLCATAAGEAFIVDFSHAIWNSSKVGRTREVEELCRILGVDAPQKKPVPKKTVEGKADLRRSSRINMLKTNTQARVG